MTHLQSQVWQVVDLVSKSFKMISVLPKSVGFCRICHFIYPGNYCILCYVFIVGVFDNTLDRTQREQRKISAPPTMETPDRRTSFIKSNSTMHGLENNVNDNQIQKMPIRNDNECPQGLPSIIPENDEPTLGEMFNLLIYGVKP